MTRQYVANASAEMPEGMDPLRTCFLDRVALVTTATVIPMKSRTGRAIAERTLAESRGYAMDDLMAIAEIGCHYLHNGGTRLALMIFDGLAAVAPREAYFALGQGLAADRSGDPAAAARAYARAARLDPTDPRPDVNLAELELAQGDRPSAALHLRAAIEKLASAPDAVLSRKCDAMLRQAERRNAR